MPSHLHEALLLLLRESPTLAAKLLDQALHVELPVYTEARVHSADLTDIQPAEYRADHVVRLLDGESVLGIVVEVQLRPDEAKRYSWPVYVTNLRARIRCPVCLLICAADETVARWAARPIELGGGNLFVPWVLPLCAVPEITSEEEARTDPELAVLSAMAHGSDADVDKAVRIALAAYAASASLDSEHGSLYFDLVDAHLSEAARRALQAMKPGYQYQSDFARKYFGQGEAEGLAQGKAELVVRLLAVRFGSVSETVQSRIHTADAAQLDAIAERVLTAGTLEEALGRLWSKLTWPIGRVVRITAISS